MITAPPGMPALDDFALPRLRAAVGDTDVALVLDAAHPDDEGFALARDGRGLTLTAGGAAGLMYGALELAERAGALAAITTETHRPHQAFRALKFNLPWSAYRWGEVMTQHIETCRTQNFWAALIDMLAENRFNVLSLWNLHPFPFMFRPAGFEEACDLSDAELREYQALFRFIFRRCRERCIKPYILFWNIFVSDAFAKAHGLTFLDGGPEYHFGDGDTSELVERYNRQCVRQLIDEYPDLAGIGAAAGDRMQNLTPTQRQEWIERVVMGGIKASSRPDIDYVHRAPFTQQPAEVRETITRAAMPGRVFVEYKFNWSHAHSSPRLCITHDEASRKPGEPLKVDDRYWNPPPADYRIVWMARNEDFFLLRWGSAAFVRAHILENARPFVEGYFVGSEGYIPAKEYAQEDPPHTYAFQRQWLFYALWGRLLYNPHTPDAVFARAFDARYSAASPRALPAGPADRPAADGLRSLGAQLFALYQHASRFALLFASFHAGTWDYTLYTEGLLAPFKSLGRHDGCAFINILELIEHVPLDPAMMGIAAFVRDARAAAGRVTPLDLAGECEALAGSVNALALEIYAAVGNAPARALLLEVADAARWAALARYTAAKLRAAVSLESFRQRGNPADHAAAIALLETAASTWRSEVAGAGDDPYRRVPYIERPRQKYRLDFHWADYVPAVEYDIEMARRVTPGGRAAG